MSREGQQAIKDQVTARMMASLQAGVIPWHQPWISSGLPRKMSDKGFYRGINRLLLGVTAFVEGYSSPFWGTMNKINQLGGRVRIGESPTWIVWWAKKTGGIDEETGKPRTFTIMRYFKVWNACQCDELPEWCYPARRDNGGAEVLEAAQAIVDGYLSRPGAPEFRYQGDEAWYHAGDDLINIPDPDSFDSPEHRYATEFHEIGHSTGHKSRLNRDGIAEFSHFGSKKYSREELASEMTSVILCAMAGIDDDAIFDNSAAYIGSWLHALNDDHDMVFKASAQASAAVDVVLGIETKEED